MKKIVLIALLLLPTSPGLAAQCQDGVVKSVSATIVTLVKGRYYFRKENFIDPKNWKAGDDLSICPYPGRDHLFYMQNVRLGESTVVADAPGR